MGMWAEEVGGNFAGKLINLAGGRRLTVNLTGGRKPHSNSYSKPHSKPRDVCEVSYETPASCKVVRFPNRCHAPAPSAQHF